jgi:hypothetical protein
MGDCPNVETRELLPERAAGLLSARDAERVDAHLAGCADCAFEMTVLLAARAALRGGRVVDVTRIAVAVVSATRSKPTIVRTSRRRVWTEWRAAASIAIIAVGAISVAVWNGATNGSRGRGANASGVEASAIPRAGDSSVGGAGSLSPLPTAGQNTPSTGLPVAAVPVSNGGLSVAGGLSDLTDTELRTLLGDIGSFDPSSVSEPEDMMPVFSGSETIQ